MSGGEKVHTQVDLTVRRMMRRKFRVPADKELHNTTHLIHDLRADSLSLMELQLDLEEAFNVVFTDAEVEGQLTLGAVVDMVERKVGGTA